MPQHKDAKKRRRTFFARIPSTFTNNNSNTVPCYIRVKKMLHSKSTYFYRWGSRKKLSSKVTFLIPSVCGLALLVGGVVAVNPTVNDEKVYAIASSSDVTGGGTGGTDAAEKPNITLEFSGPANNEATTMETGVVAYRSNTIKVSGDNVVQYSVSLNTADGDNGKLIGAENPFATINSLPVDASPADFPDNTWGYSISSDVSTQVEGMTYSPIPSTDRNNSFIISQRDNIVGHFSDEYKLVLAAKIGAEMPADHYKTSLYLSIVGSAETTAMLGFQSANRVITTMQEMNAEICSSASDNSVGQLQDTRDNKIYWIAKLKDGRCWMTQNLDFDVPAVLQEETSDVLYTKAVPVSYTDPGNYYYDGPSDSHAQGEYCGSVASCSQFSTTGSDTHYHIGNYYQFGTAAAGSDSIQLASGNNTMMSICPKGWKLPSNEAFGTLFKQYGFTNGGGLITTLGNMNYAVYNAPLYFVFGGWGGGRASSQQGYYWTSTVISTNKLSYSLRIDQYLHLTNSNIDGNNTNNQSHEISVRCINDPNN